MSATWIERLLREAQVGAVSSDDLHQIAMNAAKEYAALRAENKALRDVLWYCYRHDDHEIERVKRKFGKEQT